MKTIIYYDEIYIPSKIRIVSHKLCLDHFVVPEATMPCVQCLDLQELMNSNLVDELYICFTPESAFLQIPNAEMQEVVGWQKIKPSNLVLRNIEEIRGLDS